MSERWNRVADVRAFLASQGRRSVGVHQMKNVKRMPWPLCTRCGLLALRNDASRKALREQCVVEE
ncbi:MAG TPA: hypothetical protein VGF45_06375 [Polyangia bacterium]